MDKDRFARFPHSRGPNSEPDHVDDHEHDAADEVCNRVRFGGEEFDDNQLFLFTDRASILKNYPAPAMKRIWLTPCLTRRWEVGEWSFFK
jgi:hypothetical protein